MNILARLPGRLAGTTVLCLFAIAARAEVPSQLRIRVSWGHQSTSTSAYQVSLGTNHLVAAELRPVGLEPGEEIANGRAHGIAGAGDVDGLEAVLLFSPQIITEITNVHQIWRHLLEHTKPDAAKRLRKDPGYRPDPRQLTIRMNEEETRGFSLTIDQLLTQGAFWVPELDVFVSAGEPAITFQQHLASLAPSRGQRVLDRVDRESEARYEDFTALWEDMGNPGYRNPHSVEPGHIVCLAWDSSIPKFGVDRGANVWNDYGNPDRFRLGLDLGTLDSDLEKRWRGQDLEDGLPVIRTRIEKEGVLYVVEQFACPLKGVPNERRGDIPMVLLQKVTATELSGKPKNISLSLTHRRELTSGMLLKSEPGRLNWLTQDGNILLTAEGVDAPAAPSGSGGNGQEKAWRTNTTELRLELPARGTREFVLKLPSAPVPATNAERLPALDYAMAKKETLQFWSDWLERGAQFEVPDEAVNSLFRASLWHALRLPRRHGGADAVQIDLPYSNFGYDQTGTPWPVNQAIYVDSMLYDLRGYHDVSREELAAIYRNNQETNGHVGGFANWGVYSPSMIYASAKNFLLSGDRAAFESLLPQTLRAFDWCQGEIRATTSAAGEAAEGLVRAPLNDLSHDRMAWAFNQAYLFAGPDMLARALQEYGHPRAAEVRVTARAMFEAIELGFSRASVSAPLIQLADLTWSPYVPGDALTPRRLFEIWYPTDVDCGPLHLSRLRALDPRGPLTTRLLHDNEDNLFLKQWGMANEPVYNQHATAYLWRDEPKRAIRAFYSMLACAFSHTVFESVEHRWGWGQYFCPPSTDGAWFELYRNMLLQEWEDGSLRVCMATPRRWLENGERIRIERAPTYYGPVSVSVESRSTAGTITAVVEGKWRKPPKSLLVRLRHPKEQPLKAVRVNGQTWTDFDPAKEWVRIPEVREGPYTIEARY